MYCLLEVVSVCPEKLAPRFVDKIDWIKVSISLISVLNYLKHGRTFTLTLCSNLLVRQTSAPPNN